MWKCEVGMNKIRKLEDVVNEINDGAILAFGGNVLHRSPIRIAKELAKRKVKNLHLVKTAMAMEVDILCANHCVKKVSAGFIGYESQFGLCDFYRKAAQNQEIIVDEHACYSIISAFRAAIQGVPFLPIRGFDQSDLIEANHFLKVRDPYTQEEIIAIQAIVPDVGFIHAHYADEEGNAYIEGPIYEDELIAKASKRVIVTCEAIASESYCKQHRAAISSILVDCVVVLPKGAYPGAMAHCYDIDERAIRAFKSCKNEAEMQQFLDNDGGHGNGNQE